MTNATIIKPKKKEKKSKKLTVKQIKLKARSKCQADCKLPDIVIQECLDNTKKIFNEVDTIASTKTNKALRFNKTGAIQERIERLIHQQSKFASI